MATPEAPTWPTRERVEQALSKLDAANKALDELNVAYSRLIDRTDRYEPLPGVPAPSPAAVAALAVLVQVGGDALDNMVGFLEELDQTLNVAAHLGRSIEADDA